MLEYKNRLAFMAFIDRIIWFIVRYSLLFDTVNGAFLHSGNNVPISQVFKIALLLLIIVRLSESRRILNVFLIIAYTAIIVVHFSLGEAAGTLGESINHLFKFLSVPIYFMYVRLQLEQNEGQTFSRIMQAITINSFILIGNIWIGLLGLGYAQYGGNIGYRGYFYAGNEVSGVLLMLFPVLLYQLAITRGIFNRKYAFYCLVMLITGILTVTKTAMLGVLLTVCLIPMIVPGVISRKKKKLFPLILLLLLPIIGVIFYYGLTQSGVIEHWTYFYEKNGIWFFLSGRDNRILDEVTDFVTAGWSGWVLGLGGNRTVEMDPIDTLFNYGIVGLLFVYGFYFYLIVSSRIRRKKNRYAPLVFFCNVVLLCASTISGHILFSGMAGIFIALVNGLMFYGKTEKDNSPLFSTSIAVK